jgi:hypothetical protein
MNKFLAAHGTLAGDPGKARKINGTAEAAGVSRVLRPRFLRFRQMKKPGNGRTVTGLVGTTSGAGQGEEHQHLRPSCPPEPGLSVRQRTYNTLFSRSRHLPEGPKARVPVPTARYLVR